MIIVTPPACPTGQHLNDEGVCEEESGCPAGQHTGEDGECQDDYECGDDEIGGGSEECVRCPWGKEPNEDRTACVDVSPYKVARCSRPMTSVPDGLNEYLPYHVNVFVEGKRGSGEAMERGFFASDFTDAIQKAIDYSLFGVLAFTPGSVYQDEDLGECVYESDVDSVRYKRVRNRMMNYRWRDYHLLAKDYGHNGYGTCIVWADSVLSQGSQY